MNSENQNITNLEEIDLNRILSEHDFISSLLQSTAAISDIDFKRFILGVNKLREEGIEIPFLSIPEELPKEWRDNLIAFRLDLLKPKLRNFLDFFLVSKFKSNSEVLKSFISTYIIFFEFVMKNIINPIIKNIDPSQGKQLNYVKKIEMANQEIEKYNLTNSIGLFLDDMNVTLRNALLHNQYFIKDDYLYYYSLNWEMKVTDKGKISFQEIRKKNSLTAITFQVFYILSVENLKTSI